MCYNCLYNEWVVQHICKTELSQCNYKGPGVYSFCNSQSKIEEKIEREHNIYDLKQEGREKSKHQQSQKLPYEWYYTGIPRASKLHDLLRCHHRSDESIQIPMSDIFQIKSSESCLG